MDPKKDYYKALGVSESATQDEIRKAFRRMAKKHHPDVNPGDKSAEARFKEVNEANEVLGNRKKREEYDAIRKGGFTGGPWSGEEFRGWNSSGGGRSSGAGRVGSINLEDIFGQLFRQGDIGGASPPGRGQDISVEVSVDFMEMIRGGVHEVRYRTPKTCHECGGSGKSGRRSCPVCFGHGITEAEELVKVKIPAGAKDGATIRVSSKGGKNSDLVVRLRMLPHKYFRREGNDIFLDAPIRFSEAVKGAKIQVPTIDGPVMVTVPPGSSSGRKLRLKGKGAAEPGKKERGDQFVVLNIAAPKSSSEELVKLMDQLEQYEDPDPRGHWN
ncbi:MAG: DnaJ domain-containing protein [Syntrophorhabdaceae bacterium]|nr:DnaJ domain-containing protein [Syntrophorhabdaceae bacterium]